MRGVFILRPALPKYNVTWNVNKVLDYLKTIKSDDDTDLKSLTQKVVMLMALLTGQGVQSLHVLDLRNINFDDKYLKIRIGDALKQTRPGFHIAEFNFEQYTDDPNLCIVKLLQLYIEKTKLLRIDETKLFISFCKPHKSVTKDTISRWIKTVLSKAGINLNIFKPHSVRSASVSKVQSKLNVPLATIMRTAGWTKESTFRIFYNKPVTMDTSFANSILNRK